VTAQHGNRLEPLRYMPEENLRSFKMLFGKSCTESREQVRSVDGISKERRRD